MVISTKKTSRLIFAISAIFILSNNTLAATESTASEKNNAKSYESIPQRFPCDPGYRCKVVISPTQSTGVGNGGDGREGPGSEATGAKSNKHMIQMDQQSHQLGR